MIPEGNPFKFSSDVNKKFGTLLDLCVSSLRRGYANLLCIVPILTDDPRRESTQLARPTAKLARKKKKQTLAMDGHIATGLIAQLVRAFG